jgi:mannosidase alpha-like ER degradation enhancer 1
VTFDVDTKPQVFESTIRVLGGLLSAHIFANRTGQPFHLPWYRGELLTLAHDLGIRLLPAFSTPTGLPYARVRITFVAGMSTLTSPKVNLRRGVAKEETVETCGSSIPVHYSFRKMIYSNRYSRRGFIDFGIRHIESTYWR